MKPLSFIIITYNRAADMLELAENICTLDKASELLEEVIIVNNCSTEDYSAVKNFIEAEKKNIPFRYYDAPENLGVARGRNFAIQKGNAPIVIMLDDDAVLQNKNCLVNLLDEFNSPDTERPKAIISFKVLYYDTLQMQKNALPHKKFDVYRDKSFFETYFYAGGAHAVLREAIEKVGAYPTDFFYGMEEYDLSYRLLDKGYSIVYSDKIIMLHKESPLGRKPQREKIKMMWINKSKVAYRYLPIKYFYSTSFMWGLEYLKQTKFDLRGFLEGWYSLATSIKKEKRSPVRKETIEYLKSMEARLWY